MAGARPWRLVRYDHGAALPALYAEVLHLMRDVYVATDGGYPRFEWVRKPVDPDSSRFPKWFERNYGGFLKWRLGTELDSFWIARSPDNELLGVIGINLDFQRRGKRHIAGSFLRLLECVGNPVHDLEGVGFIELFAVHPACTRLGLGTRLMRTALAELKSHRKQAWVVTYHGLDPALRLYEKFGGESFEVRDFRWTKREKRGCDYIVMRLAETL